MTKHIWIAVDKDDDVLPWCWGMTKKECRNMTDRTQEHPQDYKPVKFVPAEPKKRKRGKK